MPFLTDVLEELRVAVTAKVVDGEETLLLIAKPKFKGFPPSPEQCYVLAAKDENPFISDDEADAIKRHFNPPKGPKGFIRLGL
jgi:hypothetical protein